MTYASLSRCRLLHARSPLLLRRAAVRMASSVPDISTMTVPQLKEQLRERGLPVSGVKAVLIARLTPELWAKLQSGPCRSCSFGYLMRVSGALQSTQIEKAKASVSWDHLKCNM